MALALPIRGDAGEGEWKNVLRALVPGDYVLVRFPNDKHWHERVLLQGAGGDS